MKIYDCFTFFNELDLLEVRLNELNNYVDYFVLVEAEESFTGNQKPLHFENNKERFKEFLDKIIHVKVEKRPGLGDWPRQHFQRNCITRGLKDADPEDIIIISDIDEIPRGSVIPGNLPVGDEIVAFMVRYYGYFLNRRIFRTNPKYPGLDRDFMSGPRLVRKSSLKEPEKIRSFPGNRCKKVEDAGWHFSWMGNMEVIELKAASVSGPTDVKDPNKDGQAWLNKIERFRKGEGLFGVIPWNGFTVKKVPIDHTFPEYIVDNTSKFQDWIFKGEEDG